MLFQTNAVQSLTNKMGSLNSSEGNATKRSLENKHLRNGNYFVIITSS